MNTVNVPGGPAYVFGKKNIAYQGNNKVSSKNNNYPTVSSSYQTDIPMTEGATILCDILSDSGYQPMIVGGYVRDYVLGSPTKDIDVEVYGASSVSDVIKTLNNNNVKTDNVGQSFGVIKAIIGGEDVDISLPRKDSLPDGGLSHRDINAEIDPNLSFEEATRRRDFTMNAIMFDPITKNIVDCHGGLDDINDNVIRVVDEKTFVEDPLRVLRGVQFSSRFNMSLGDETIDLCSSMSPVGLTKERVAGELHKMILKSSNLHRGIEAIHDIGWESIIPNLVNNIDNPVSQRVVNKCNSSEYDENCRMALNAVLIDNYYGSGNRETYKYLMLTNREKRIANDFPVSQGDNLLEYSRMRRAAYSNNISDDTLDDIIKEIGVVPAEKLWTDNPPEYKVNGKILLDRGVKPDKRMKMIIDECRDIEDSGHKVTDSILDKTIRKYDN